MGTSVMDQCCKYWKQKQSKVKGIRSATVLTILNALVTSLIKISFEQRLEEQNSLTPTIGLSGSREENRHLT